MHSQKWLQYILDIQAAMGWTNAMHMMQPKDVTYSRYFNLLRIWMAQNQPNLTSIIDSHPIVFFSYQQNIACTYTIELDGNLE